MPIEALIIEDDQDIVELVRHYFEKENFILKDAGDGVSGLRKAETDKPDLIILDLMLPELDGLEVCRELKSNPKTSSIPIIMLTAKGEETDKIVGLELGADDYITKPFSPKELVARVKALIRRSKRTSEKEKFCNYGKLTLDSSKYEVNFEGKPIQLTSKEFALLECLLSHKGRVLSRDFLMDEVWGYNYYGGMRTVDVHIRRLREKIPGIAEKILTIKNLGYKLKESP